MGELIRKSHNVPLLMYHFVFVAKYRRFVINKEADNLPRSICSEISKRCETVFPEIGREGDHVHFLIQSVPTYSPAKIVTIVKSLTTGGEHANEDVIRKYIKKQGRDGNYKQLHKIKNIRKQITLF